MWVHSQRVIYCENKPNLIRDDKSITEVVADVMVTTSCSRRNQKI